MESPLASSSLYGEQHHGPAVVDRLHCESIEERSRQHQWEIHAHHHALLYQLFWIEQGGCAASIDGRLHEVQGPALLLLPPGTMHGFHFDPAVQGLVITVQAQHLQRLLEPHAELRARITRAGAHALRSVDTAGLRDAAIGLRTEFMNRDPAWRALVLDNALLRLLVACGRSLPPEGQSVRTTGGRTEEHVRRYQSLVEQEFRGQPALSDCAARLGISSTQLNRVCQKALGCSALDVLQARLLLEAQRELAYTSMSIKQIALGLGFADQAYFTRFYQRLTGVPPTRWRQRTMNGAA